MDFLNANHTLAVYETEGGEHGFIRYGIETVQAEASGFSSAITERFVCEAVFVSAEDAPQVRFILATRSGGDALADLLDDLGIDYRHPGGLHTAAVTDLGAYRRRPAAVAQAAG